MLDRLHDGLEMNTVEVRIKIPNHPVARCPYIRCYRSPDGWVFTRTVTRRCHGETHHADAAGLNIRVLVDIAPEFRVIFDGVPIGGHP
jgi:hypothetical protein